MTENSNHQLILAVFNGTETAETAVNKIPKWKKDKAEAIVIQKDADSKLTFHDVGKTPTRSTVGGIVLGGALGLLTGGASLAFGVLGGVLGHHHGKKQLTSEKIPEGLSRTAGSLGPNSSAIIAVVKGDVKPETKTIIEEMGGDFYQTDIPADIDEQSDAKKDEIIDDLLEALADKTGGAAKLDVPYRKIHVIINPVSGKDQPILNTLNDVFYKNGIYWDISITKKFGDATKFARKAAESGYDLVVGYGGDGTQHEIANGVMGTGVTMGVLPGGTGNGFGNEMGIPTELGPAAELFCTSYNTRNIDIVKLEEGGEGYFVQRLFTGIEPEEQTSREDKNKYGTLAYLGRDIKRLGNVKDIKYTLTIDGETIEVMGHKCYVVNSAKAGTGLSISNKFEVDDGYLDVFMLSQDKQSTNAALNRFFNLDNEKTGMFYWRGQNIKIDAETDQPVWTDGEYTSRTPVSMKVIPGGLTVVVP